MEFTYKNIMEDIVLTKFFEVKDMIDCCKCDKCAMDIIALTLNQLPARYVANDKGRVFCKLESATLQDEVTTLALLIKSAEIVNKKPRH